MSTFSFKEGLSLISAKNGSGKTTLLEVLSFNWYGKPYRDIKISELINRKNKKNMYTETEFDIDGTTYNIVRTLSPSKLTIKKDGIELENLSAKKLDQEEINKVLGVDYNIFKLIIALSVNYNKPFLSLGTPAKRDTIESIFNIKIFGEMLVKLKKKASTLKSERTLLDGTIKTLESSISSFRKQIKELKSSIGDIDKKNEDEIKLHKDKIKESNKIIDSLAKKAEAIKKELKTLVITDVTNEYSKIRNEIAVSKSKILELSEQLAFFETHDECPKCGILMTQEHRESEIKNAINQKTALEIVLQNLFVEFDRLRDVEVENGKISSKIQELKNSMYETIQDAKTENNNIELLNKQIRLISERTLVIDTKSITEEYEKQIEEYKIMAKRLDEVKNTLLVYEYVSKVLSEDGIKSFFFKKLVPILNKKINEYLTSFEIPIIINFNEFMEENIRIPLSNMQNVSYMAFSEGEKKRIDVAILLSFIETTKILSNWNCNVLMFDEVLDNATDSEGLEKLLNSIKLLTRNDTKLCSYVISHRESDSEIYDRKISIKKVAGFSKLV
jgi:DNA repair exonuclease SbcCD ATPase subunit